MYSAEEIIKRVTAVGVTKYQIAKTCDVTWQTVHMWSRGVFKPNKDRFEKLKNLLDTPSE